MKYQPRDNGMIVEEPFWEDLPVIQRQEELPIEDFQTENHPSSAEEPSHAAIPLGPSPESKLVQTELTDEPDEFASDAGSQSRDDPQRDSPSGVATPILLLQQPEPLADQPPAEEPHLTLLTVTEAEVRVMEEAVAEAESLIELESPIPSLTGQKAESSYLYSMEDVETVKGLCDRLGVETLLALIDLLN